MHVKKILSYLKTAEGLSDQELSQRLGINSKRLDSLMKSPDDISIDEAEAIADQFNISPIALEDGIIKSSQSLEDTEIENRFKQFQIPEYYQKYAKSSGFLRQIYIDSFIKILGFDAFEIFCQKEGIDPLYFTDWSNPIHPDFNLLLMRELAQRNLLDDHLMGKIASQYVFSTVGNISMLDIPARMSAANNWVNLLNKIEKCHDWEVLECSEKDIEFSFCPFDFMNMNLYKKDQFLKDAKERYIRAFASQLIDLPINVKQSFIGGADKTILSTKV